MCFWPREPPPMPGFLLISLLLIEKVGFGRAPAISRCASADSTVRRAALSSRLCAASSPSASVSDRSRASHGVEATANATQKANATRNSPRIIGMAKIRTGDVHTLAANLPEADAALQHCGA